MLDVRALFGFWCFDAMNSNNQAFSAECDRILFVDFDEEANERVCVYVCGRVIASSVIRKALSLSQRRPPDTATWRAINQSEAAQLQYPFQRMATNEFPNCSNQRP